jgi:hypothetical protein
MRAEPTRNAATSHDAPVASWVRQIVVPEYDSV